MKRIFFPLIPAICFGVQCFKVCYCFYEVTRGALLEKSQNSWEIAKISKAKLISVFKMANSSKELLFSKRNWRNGIFLETPSVFPDFKTWNSWISKAHKSTSTLSKEKLVRMKNDFIWGMSCHLQLVTSMFSSFKNFTKWFGCFWKFVATEKLNIFLISHFCAKSF